ncbi:MAG: ABC transporter ATP-binding protein [Deinococcales bacterium]
MANILIDKVGKHFGNFHALKEVSLEIKDQEFMVLLGPSGCGKTTLLRAIAGLGMADSGRILLDGKDITYLPPRMRGMSMVFQSYAIFPHMTVFDNIAFGLKMRGLEPKQIKKQVGKAAELLHIEAMLERYPHKMSGGQRQRVAVARAIAMQAEVLLMDEPLSNLDALLRLEMRAELKRLLSDIKVTTIYVTHDQIEALSMGDRIAVMKDGIIQQVDVPGKVYDLPQNRFVGSFIGNPPMNFLKATILTQGGQLWATIADFSFEIEAKIQEALKTYVNQEVILGIRAENMEVLAAPDPKALGLRVQVLEPLGSQNLLTVSICQDKLKVSTHPDFPAKTDELVWLRFPSDKIRWIDPQSGQSLRA